MSGWKHFTYRVILTRSEISGISATVKIIQMNSTRNYKYQPRAPSSGDRLALRREAARRKTGRKEKRCDYDRSGGGVGVVATEEGGGVVTCL